MSITPPAPAATSHDSIIASAFFEDSLTVGLARWQALEQRIGRQGWACSYDWVEAYIHHYGDFAEIECVIVSRDGVDIGAGLLSRKNLSNLGPLGFRALLNGTGGEPDGDPFYCEHHRLLATSDEYAAVEQVITTRALQKQHVDAVYWSGYEPNQVASLLDRDRRCHVTERNHPAINLIDRKPSPTEGEWITSPDAAGPHLARLIESNRNSWGHVGQGLYQGRFERFLFDVTCRMLKSGSAAVVADSKSCVVLFFDAQQHCRQPKNDHQQATLFAYADGGPDDEALRTIHRTAADLAAARGFQRYDFPYDTIDGVDKLADMQISLLWVRIAKLSWRSQLLFGLSRLKQAIRG